MILLSSFMKISSASVIWKSVILAFLMKGIYDVRHWNGFR
jgi:hypothetical protein